MVISKSDNSAVSKIHQHVADLLQCIVFLFLLPVTFSLSFGNLFLQLVILLLATDIQ